MVDYATVAQVKERALIASSDTAYDTRIATCITEAMRMVDIFLTPYVDVPLTTIPAQIGIITADFATSIFKSRYFPDEVELRGTTSPDGLNQTDSTGWFAIGLRKMNDYIKNVYSLKTPLGTTVYNPETYVEFVKLGLMTPKDAKAAMSAANSLAIQTIETKTETLIKTETITSTETKTKTQTDTQTKTLSEEDTIEKTITEDLTKEETLTKDETVNKTINITENTQITKTTGKTKFSMIEANPDTNGYTTQEDGIYREND
jgi:hypothetical protein